MPLKKTVLKKKVGPRKGDSDSTADDSESSETSSQSARNSSATCGVCDQTIVDGKEQALFCDGVCKQWFHRYCAGVPLSWFKTLSTSSSYPFSVLLMLSGNIHHSFPGSLDWTVSDRYLSIPTDKTLAIYIWIDATGQVIIFITNVGVCSQFVF